MSEQLVYGENSQLQFANANEKYQAIGFITNPKNVRISFEPNTKTNSWGDAYRFHVERPTQAPVAIQNALRTQERMNCNEFCEELINSFGFQQTGSSITGDCETVKARIPDNFIEDFEVGYAL